MQLDDYVITEEKDKDGQQVQVERPAKGLVSKCLEKDGSAFKPLENTKSKSKEQRLSLLCECRPEGCCNAVDLALWLVEVSRELQLTSARYLTPGERRKTL